MKTIKPINEEELNVINNLNLLRLEIFPYNYHIIPSNIGLPWVLLWSFPCISIEPEDDSYYLFNAEKLKIAFEVQLKSSVAPEDFFNNLIIDSKEKQLLFSFE